MPFEQIRRSGIHGDKPVALRGCRGLVVTLDLGQTKSGTIVVRQTRMVVAESWVSGGDCLRMSVGHESCCRMACDRLPAVGAGDVRCWDREQAADEFIIADYSRFDTVANIADAVSGCMALMKRAGAAAVPGLLCWQSLMVPVLHFLDFLAAMLRLRSR